MAEWCATNGINRKPYCRWEQKLLREAGNKLCYTKRSQQLRRFKEMPTVHCTTDAVAMLRTGEIARERHDGISLEQLNAIVQVMNRHA